jgi:hypothetical protein
VSFSFFATYIALWIFALIQGLLLLSVLQQLTKLRHLLEQGELPAKARLPVGSEAPEFVGTDHHTGEQVGIQNLGAQGGVILFLSPSCSVCKYLASTIGKTATEELPPILAFCSGDQEACAGLLETLGSAVQPLDGADGSIALYHISSFPTAVVIDGDRKIRAYGFPRSVESLSELYSKGITNPIPEVAQDAHSTVLSGFR